MLGVSQVATHKLNARPNLSYSRCSRSLNSSKSNYSSFSKLGINPKLGRTSLRKVNSSQVVWKSQRSFSTSSLGNARKIPMTSNFNTKWSSMSWSKWIIRSEIKISYFPDKPSLTKTAITSYEWLFNPTIGINWDMDHSRTRNRD